MADSAKKEKIAAARKKLKQFQKTGKSSKSRDSTASPKAKVQKNTHNLSNGAELITDNSEVENGTEAQTVGINNTQNPTNDNQYSENSEVISDKGARSGRTNDNSGSVFIDENKDNIGEKVIEKSGPATSASNLNSTEPSSQISQGVVTDSNYQPTASTESLQQLSRQINGILAESPVGFEVEQSQSEIVELETRNRELASLLAQHAQANEQLTTQNEQIRQHALGVQSQLDKERTAATQKLTKEIGPLKEQLQVHIQTIGILVAEKTELQSQLSQSQKISEQRFGEIEDITGRLKTSRTRVADLERSLSSTNTSSQKHEQSSKDSAKEIDRLKLELYKLNKSHEEVKQNSSEVQEKLKSKISESSGLQQSVDELKQRLEMAELYVQQLSSQNEAGQETLQIVGQLQQERDTLASQVRQYTESFQKVSAERDQVTEQYKQYMEQLQNQNTQLSQQVTSLTGDREKFVTQNHDLESAVQELQRKLEDVDSRPAEVDESMRSEMLQEVTKLQTEYSELRQRHEAQIRDNAQLSRFLEEKETHILELESRLEDLGEQAGDKAELLENIQSDKTALSRALTQNKDLKIQLAELQNGFVKMSNDNMEMMTQLQTEQHASCDLKTRLSQQEEEIKQVRELLSQKEVDLNTAQESTVEAMKVKLLHEQIQDRLRHYEAQAQLVETLQKELHSSQDMVDALTTQNSELRTMLIRATETRALNPDTNVENAQREDVIDSLQATIQQLESERNQMVENLNKQLELTDHLGVRVSDLEEEVVQNSASNPDKVSRNEYDKVKYALDMIQDKYNHVMRDKADLSDKADELEHLVLQLQGETDTIGEYISLYHHQRALLQQRELQKNDYISQLAKDREELQDKLGELQALVMQLMGEKNMLHSYTEETRRSVSPSIHPPVAQHAVHHERHDDWPDYTSSESDTESEVETIVGGKDDVHPDQQKQQQQQQQNTVIDDTPPTHIHNNNHNNARMDTDHSDQDHTDASHVHHEHHEHHEHRSRTHSRSEVGEEKTAHKILNLLSEIGHSNWVDNLSFMEKQFHPCKYCKGRLQIL